MEITTVITAKAESSRLPNKNLLPLGGKPLFEWSLLAAQQIPNSNVVVSTDSDIIKEVSEKKYNFQTIFQQRYRDGIELSHIDIIKQAAYETHSISNHIVLLQPTSPFRTGNIISKCFHKLLEYPDSTILTTSKHHFAELVGGKLTNHNSSITLWDGCVVIYPPNKIGNYDNVVGVSNNHINSLQIDSREDYTQACLAYETFKPIDNILSLNLYHLLKSIFIRAGLVNKVTLVGRPNGLPIPQQDPVVYLNHCKGYDGNRCDGLFIIANPHIKKVGINPELRECATKAKFVIIRHNGELDWLLYNLPIIKDKFFVLRDAINHKDDHLTTGCIAAHILKTIGLSVNMIGLYDIENAGLILDKFHYPSLSREIALWNDSIMR